MNLRIKIFIIYQIDLALKLVTVLPEYLVKSKYCRWVLAKF